MEGMDIYVNTTAFHIYEKNGGESEEENLKPERWPRRADTPRRNLPRKIIYTILGICILVSVSSLVLAIILIAQMGEMKRSGADFRMESCQWKCNVTGTFENAASSLSELQAEISRLRESASIYHAFNQWRFFNQRLYYFSSKSETWDEALKFCAAMNSTFVVINSAEEQDYIRGNTYLMNWIGLRVSAVEGTWRWVDGTDYDTNVKFWMGGSPNSNKDNDENRVVAFEDGLWYEWSCNSMHTTICEKPAQ